MSASVIAVTLAAAMGLAMAAVAGAWVGAVPADVGRVGLAALGILVPAALLVTVVLVTRRR